MYELHPYWGKHSNVYSWNSSRGVDVVHIYKCFAVWYLAKKAIKGGSYLFHRWKFVHEVLTNV